MVVMMFIFSFFLFVYLFFSTTGITCNISFEGVYPTAEYREFVQKIILVATGDASITSISILTLLVFMMLAILA